eukprot:2793895-Pleurochrysis_carterae.AAC.2
MQSTHANQRTHDSECALVSARHERVSAGVEGFGCEAELARSEMAPLYACYLMLPCASQANFSKQLCFGAHHNHHYLQNNAAV